MRRPLHYPDQLSMRITKKFFGSGVSDAESEKLLSSWNTTKGWNTARILLP